MSRPRGWAFAVAAGLGAALGACQSGSLQDCDPTGPPRSTECKVVIFRSGGYPDAGRYPIFHQLTWVGDSEPGCYFELLCAPGKHHFIVLSEPPGPVGAETVTRSPANWAAVEADLAPGKTYYIRSFVQAVHLSGGRAPRLAPAARQSEEMVRADETLKDLRCTRLDPAKVRGERPSVEARIRAVYKEIAEISGQWTYLSLEDGR
jgi:hypothetical protein